MAENRHASSRNIGGAGKDGCPDRLGLIQSRQGLAILGFVRQPLSWVQFKLGYLTRV